MAQKNIKIVHAYIITRQQMFAFIIALLFDIYAIWRLDFRS